MIVLWGLIEDGPLAAVHGRLQELHKPFVFVDQRRVQEYEFELQTSGNLNGRILGPDCSVKIDDVQSIYLRPYNFADLDIFAGVDQSSELFKRAVDFEGAMLAWCEMTNAMVVNRPCKMGSNSSKPFQLEIIRNAGFRVPETLITTDPACVAQFHNKYRRVIYKSISGVRSIVSQLTEKDLERVEDVACCPTQFQRFIAGTDYRVHVLNETVFAHRIKCPDDDYRYSQDARIEPAKLDGELEEQCVRLAQKLGLEFAGIDLRQSVDGDWYCFEVNPSPGFTHFDHGAGDISLAVANHLATGSTVNPAAVRSKTGG